MKIVNKKPKERDLFCIKSGAVKKERRTKDHEENKKKNDLIEKELKADFDPITYENITEGQNILGCIMEIRKFEMIVSLPNKCKGYLPITNISKAYKELLTKVSDGEDNTETVYNLNDLYSVGHMIITQVKSVVLTEISTTKVILSILPEDVNKEMRVSVLCQGSVVQGAVSSTQEKGFVMDTGIKNLRSAFLPRKNVPEGMTVGVGSVLVCTVTTLLESDEDTATARVRLTAMPESVFEAAPFLDEDTHLAALNAGTVIDATVERVYRYSLQLKTKWRTGVVGADHLIKPSDRFIQYTVGQEVKARILYVTNLTNIMHCTLNGRVCDGSLATSPYQSLRIGDVIDNAKVYKCGNEGVHFLLPHGSHGFCSRNKLQQRLISEEDVKRTYPVDSTHTCRIIHVNLMDQLFIVALKMSIVSEEILGQQDLEIGQTMKVKILEHNDCGMEVALSEYVKGFVPKMHLADTPLNKPELKRPVGQSVMARIIRHVPGEKPHLTLKKQLVKSCLPIVSSFDEKYVGVNTIGCVAKIYKAGLLVELFGEAKAFILANTIPIANGKDISTLFEEHSAIECKIVSVDEENQKMMAVYGDSVSKPPKKVLKVRDIVNCQVKCLDEDNVVVSVEGYDGPQTLIPKYHLADDVEYAKSIFALLKKEDVIKGVVVFDKTLKGRTLLSAKSSVIQSVTDLKNRNIETGDIFPAVITHIGEKNISVKSMKKLTGIISVRKEELCDHKLEEASHAGVQRGQTLFVKLNRNENFSSTLTSVMRNKEESSLQLLYNTLATEAQIRRAFYNLEGEHKFSAIKVGAKHVAKVVLRTAVGTLVNLPKLGLDGVIQKKHYDKSVPEHNKTIEVRILCVNYKENCLELTAKGDIGKLRSRKNHNVEVGKETTCKVLLAKKEFILAKLKEFNGQLVYMPAKRHMNDFKGRSSFYEIGKQYKVKIRYVEDEIILADLVDHVPKNDKELHVRTQIPIIDIKNTIPVSSLSPITLNAESYTSHDFYSKVKDKVERATQYVQVKKQARKKKVPSKLKLDTLKKDSFPQFDDEFYWKLVKEERDKRRKKQKLPGKRKADSEGVEQEGKKMRKEKKLPGKRKADSEGLEQEEKSMRKENKLSGEREADSEGLKQEEKKKKKVKKLSGERKDDSKGLESRPKKRPKTVKKKEDSELEVDDKKTKKEGASCLQIQTNGFDWSGQLFNEVEDEADQESDDSGDEELNKTKKEQRTVKKLSKFERALQAKTEENKTRELELQRLHPDREPETALDFEEKIERNPNSSSSWIEYVSFYLENAETEKAKEVAARGLKVIPSRLEEERLAMWNVALCLEVMYGTPESTQAAYKEALVTNDELKICYIMLDVYANAHKVQECEDVIKTMTKKYSQNKEVWIRAGLFYFKSKALNEARNILDKSLLSLPVTDHIDVINRFAQFELKFGEAERGKTIFEKIVSHFPKRLDVWNVYCDLLIKNNDIQGARVVLERMIGLKLKIKAMRTVFKRFLHFEKEHGTPQRVEAVKERVERYVETALKEQSE